MCKCDQRIRTPFCGRPGCEWPTDEKEKMTSKTEQLKLEISGLDIAIKDMEKSKREKQELLEKIENEVKSVFPDEMKNPVVLSEHHALDGSLSELGSTFYTLEAAAKALNN